LLLPPTIFCLEASAESKDPATGPPPSAPRSLTPAGPGITTAARKSPPITYCTASCCRLGKRAHQACMVRSLLRNTAWLAPSGRKPESPQDHSTGHLETYRAVPGCNNSGTPLRNYIAALATTPGKVTNTTKTNGRSAHQQANTESEGWTTIHSEGPSIPSCTPWRAATSKLVCAEKQGPELNTQQRAVSTDPPRTTVRRATAVDKAATPYVTCVRRATAEVLSFDHTRGTTRARWAPPSSFASATQRLDPQKRGTCRQSRPERCCLSPSSSSCRGIRVVSFLRATVWIQGEGVAKRRPPLSLFSLTHDTTRKARLMKQNKQKRNKQIDTDGFRSAKT